MSVAQQKAVFNGRILLKAFQQHHGPCFWRLHVRDGRNEDSEDGFSTKIGDFIRFHPPWECDPNVDFESGDCGPVVLRPLAAWYY